MKVILKVMQNSNLIGSASIHYSRLSLEASYQKWK